jgi:hypothetical protein
MTEKVIEKKVVGRNVAIALGIICIILIVGLGGAMAYYTMTINDKNATYDSYTSTHSHTNSEYDLLFNQMVGLQIHYDNIVTLGAYTIWVDSETVNQPAGSYWSFSNMAYYAGYISVWIKTSTTDNTYARVIWSAYGIDYDETITIGTNGTANFLVLPAKSIEIRVGNTNLIDEATETVTITYRY